MKKLVYKIKNMVKNIFNKKTSKSQDDIPTHLEYPKISIYELIERTATKYPDNLAYEYFGNVATYKEFIKKIKTVSSALKKIGVAKNDRVTICMPNTPSAIITFYAVNMIGATANMIHPLSSENEILMYLKMAKSKYLLTIDLAYDKVCNIMDKIDLKKVIVSAPNDEMTKTKSALYWFFTGRKHKIKKNKNTILFKEFYHLGNPNEKDLLNPNAYNEEAVILYSGGTTGDPKGIVLSNLNFNALAIECEVMCATAKEGDSVLSIMPIFHGFGLGICIHTILYIGMKGILIPNFNAKKFGSIIKKYKPNFIVGVPTLFEALLKNNRLKKKDLSSIRCVISGGDTLSKPLKDKVDTFLKEHGSNATVREGYGLTECVGASCLTPHNKYKEESIGIPLPDVTYKIVKIGTHDELPRNMDGEICINGPTVMMGYLDSPKETAKVLRKHEDGKVWLHTGDIGCMDEEGFVYFKQRLKRMIVSSGYNIYPSYIEKIIESHPSVQTSTVIGIDHPYKVQVAKAYIVLKEGIKPSHSIKKSIKEHCEKNLAKYTLPYEYEFRTELPKTKVGKISYLELEKEIKKKEEIR